MCSEKRIANQSPFEKFLDPNAEKYTLMAPATEQFWLIMSPKSRLVAYYEHLLVFSSWQFATRFIIENDALWPGLSLHGLRQMEWRTIVAEQKQFNKGAGLDWLGPYRGFRSYGGRYALR